MVKRFCENCSKPFMWWIKENQIQICDIFYAFYNQRDEIKCKKREAEQKSEATFKLDRSRNFKQAFDINIEELSITIDKKEKKEVWTGYEKIFLERQPIALELNLFSGLNDRELNFNTLVLIPLFEFLMKTPCKIMIDEKYEIENIVPAFFVYWLILLFKKPKLLLDELSRERASVELVREWDGENGGHFKDFNRVIKPNKSDLRKLKKIHDILEDRLYQSGFKNSWIPLVLGDLEFNLNRRGCIFEYFLKFLDEHPNHPASCYAVAWLTYLFMQLSFYYKNAPSGRIYASYYKYWVTRNQKSILTLFSEKILENYPNVEPINPLKRKIEKGSELLETFQKGFDKMQKGIAKVQKGVDEIRVDISFLLANEETIQEKLDSILLTLKNKLAGDWEKVKDVWQGYRNGEYGLETVFKKAAKGLGKKVFKKFVSIITAGLITL